MGKARAQSNWDAAGNVIGSEVGGFAKTSSPQEKTPDNSHNELSRRHEPMSVDHVGSLLVVDIVKGVEGIPSSNEKHLIREKNIKIRHGEDRYKTGIRTKKEASEERRLVVKRYQKISSG